MVLPLPCVCTHRTTCTPSPECHSENWKHCTRTGANHHILKNLGFCLPTKDKRNQSDLSRSGCKLSVVVKNLWWATIINPNGIPISSVNSWPFKPLRSHWYFCTQTQALLLLQLLWSALATSASECSRTMLWVSSISEQQPPWALTALSSRLL